jgi:hypothetical protein
LADNFDQTGLGQIPEQVWDFLRGREALNLWPAKQVALHDGNTHAVKCPHLGFGFDSFG